MKGVIFTTDECVICMERPSLVTFLHCGHKCTCIACSEQVKQAFPLGCPLCRQEISVFSTVAEAAVLPSAKELESFNRDEYMMLLRRSCAKNAGYTGGGKQARAVGRAMGSELEERVKENAGTDRYGGMKPTFVVNGDTFTVTYKVQGKRKPIIETYVYQEWEPAKEALIGMLEDDRLDVIGVATHYPEYFWLAKYHKAMDSLKEITNEKRR